jgi:hypothetical protein
MLLSYQFHSLLLVQKAPGTPVAAISIIWRQSSTDAAASVYLSIGTTELRKSTRVISEKRTGSSFSKWADRHQMETEISRSVSFLRSAAASALAASALSRSFLSQYKGVPYLAAAIKAPRRKYRVRC